MTTFQTSFSQTSTPEEYLKATKDLRIYFYLRFFVAVIPPRTKQLLSQLSQVAKTKGRSYDILSH